NSETLKNALQTQLWHTYNYVIKGILSHKMCAAERTPVMNSIVNISLMTMYKQKLNCQQLTVCLLMSSQGEVKGEVKATRAWNMTNVCTQRVILNECYYCTFRAD
ncbi:unnamed protein product, partial [Owenia fusiformis]